MTETAKRLAGETDPLHDQRKQPIVLAKILAISREQLGNKTLPEYFQSQEKPDSKVEVYVKNLAAIDEILDWFKEFEVVLLATPLAKMNLCDVQTEEIPLD